MFLNFDKTQIHALGYLIFMDMYEPILVEVDWVLHSINSIKARLYFSEKLFNRKYFMLREHIMNTVVIVQYM